MSIRLYPLRCFGLILALLSPLGSFALDPPCLTRAQAAALAFRAKFGQPLTEAELTQSRITKLVPARGPEAAALGIALPGTSGSHGLFFAMHEDGRVSFFKKMSPEECAVESALYKVSQRMGYQIVEPVVPREVDGATGTLKNFIPDGVHVGTLFDDPRLINHPNFARDSAQHDLLMMLVAEIDNSTDQYVVLPDGQMRVVDGNGAFIGYKYEVEDYEFDRALKDEAGMARLEQIPDKDWEALLLQDLGPEKFAQFLGRRDLMIAEWKKRKSKP